jgi:hypothetical protein
VQPKRSAPTRCAQERMRGKQWPPVKRSIRLSAKNMSTNQAGAIMRHFKPLFDSEAINQ